MTNTSDHSDRARQSTHDAYIGAVMYELTARGVPVDSVTITAQPHRAAAIAVDPAADASEAFGSLWHTAEWIRLRWHERNGWSWQVLYRADSEPRAAIFFGLSAVPEPKAVATWMYYSLQYPMIAPIREAGPFTTPDLEVVLRSYAVHAE